MKIMINYDLISKIREYQLGFSLQKCTKRIISASSISTALSTIFSISAQVSIVENSLKWIPFYISMNILYSSIEVKLTSSRTKVLALNKLIELSEMLRDINVNTDYELLLESYVYDTKYKLLFNDNLLPYIKQDKYIMVPAYNNGEEKEISLVQEHVIGSSEYTISHGSPKKVLKLATSSI